MGRDIRESSGELQAALTRGLTDSGVDVADIGLCGTEGVYFATFAQKLDGGIMVTASHNPPDYNGMKFVREQSKPISADTGLQEMRQHDRRSAQLPGKGVRRARYGAWTSAAATSSTCSAMSTPPRSSRSKWSSMPATAVPG